MKRVPIVPVTRRRFLRHSAAGALAGLAFPTLISSAARAAGTAAPSNQITVGLIGAGPQGLGVMRGFLAEAGARVVAVCDVKPEQVERARELVNQRYGNRDCATFTDFREVLARPDIDTVIVATPDHWHVLIGIAAVRAGKDVYLEKPLGHSVAEGQAMRAAVRATGRVFQFGTQQRSSAFFRQACEIVRNGRIGQLRHINVWCIGSVPGGSTEEVSVPAGFDYDRWLGPAPFRPHRRDFCIADSAKKTWWFNSDYTLGFIAGWGVHPMDIARWGYPALTHGPLEVTGSGTIPDAGACDTATTWDVNFRSATGVSVNFQGLPITANVGSVISQVRLWQEKYQRTRDHGTAFEGTDGWVHVDRSHVASYPADLVKESPDAYTVRLPHSNYHAKNFLESVRSRQPTITGVEEAFQSDLVCHLGNLAVRTGRKLKWDPRLERFENDPGANRLLAARPMRQPWVL
jgi:predicted dehydrogenase